MKRNRIRNHRTGIHLQIAELLGEDTLSTAEIAQRLCRAYWGVRSALIAMRRRGEVQEIPARQRGMPYSYRLVRRSA